MSTSARKAFVEGAKNGHARGRREEHNRSVKLMKELLMAAEAHGADTCGGKCSRSVKKAHTFCNEKWVRYEYDNDAV